jgi:hypothetical protein
MPTPTDGATTVRVNTSLEWPPTVRTQTYSLYLWDESAQKPDHPTSKALAVAFFQPVATLDFGASYRWQVLAVDEDQVTTGPVWSFNTEPNEY